jgi:hypothetical protein
VTPVKAESRATRSPVPRSRSGLWGRRRERTGTEPVTARSALGLRLLLSSVFVPVFLAATALFWYWTGESGPRDVPSSGSLRVLAIACAVVAALALLDLVVLLMRRRREHPPPPP